MMYGFGLLRITHTGIVRSSNNIYGNHIKYRGIRVTLLHVLLTNDLNNF